MNRFLKASLWICVLGVELYCILFDLPFLEGQRNPSQGVEIAQLMEARNSVRLQDPGDLVWRKGFPLERLVSQQTLLTQEDSSADLAFDEGLGVQVVQNSMVVIRNKETPDGPLRMELLRGTLQTQPLRTALEGAPAQKMQLQMGRAQLLYDGAADFVATVDPKNPELSHVLVRSGQVSAILNGKVLVANAGQAISIPTDPQSSAGIQIRSQKILLQEPTAGKRLKPHVPVVFRWKFEDSLAQPMKSQLALELSRDSSFERKLKTKKNIEGEQVRLDLGSLSGQLYWRVRLPDQSFSAIDYFVVEEDQAPQPIAPESGTKSLEGQAIEFVWSEVKGAKTYELSVESVDSSSSSSSQAFQLQLSQPLYRTPRFGVGKYRWSVRAFLKDSTAWSPKRSFEVIAPTPTPSTESKASVKPDRPEKKEQKEKKKSKSKKKAAPQKKKKKKKKEKEKEEKKKSKKQKKKKSSPPPPPPPPSLNEDPEFERSFLNPQDLQEPPVWKRWLSRLGELLLPSAHADTESTWIVHLRWGSVEGVDRYKIQIARTRAFQKIYVDQIIEDSEYSWTYHLGQENSAGRVYYRVASVGEDGAVGGFSSPRKIQIPQVYVERSKEMQKTGRLPGESGWGAFAGLYLGAGDVFQKGASSPSQVKTDGVFLHQKAVFELTHFSSGEGLSLPVDLEAARFEAPEDDSTLSSSVGVRFRLDPRWIFGQRLRWGVGLFVGRDYRWKGASASDLSLEGGVGVGPSFRAELPLAFESLFLPRAITLNLGLPLSGFVFELAGGGFSGVLADLRVEWKVFTFGSSWIGAILEGDFDYRIWKDDYQSMGWAAWIAPSFHWSSFASAAHSKGAQK